jgi:uncharacterized protein (DUF2141 family)
MRIRHFAVALSAVSILAMSTATWAGQFRIDLGSSGGSAAGWDVFTTSVTDASVTDVNSVDNDVTLSIGALGGTGTTGAGDTAGGTPIDGITVPSAAWDDYFWGPVNGGTVLFELKNLDAGDYNVSVFMGRNNSQFGRIWAGTLGDDPGSENTGDYGFGSSTLAVTVGAGDSLFYVHQEDNTGGTSGLIVQTASANPVISTLSPADDAVDVLVSTNLVATFDRDIAAGTGDITIKNLTDATQASFPVGDAQVSILGAVLTIDPTTDLDAGDEYAIQIANGAIEDASMNPFAGIADDTTWSFFTDATAPMSSAMGPMAGATDASALADLTLLFDEDVQVGTGNIEIFLADGTPVETIDVTTGAVTINGAEVTIDIGDLADNTSYYVNIAAGAFQDLSGNPYAGINDDTTWAFTTAPPVADALALFLIDLATNSGAAAGWDVFSADVTDAVVTDQLSGDNDVTLTTTDLGGENNPNGGGATTVDGVAVPAEANDDYAWGSGGTGSTALLEFKNLDPGTYNVSVFEGRTTDSNGQFGRIWVGTAGDDPGSENTGDFAGSSATLVDLTIGAGASLFYLHQEDNVGGTSGLIIKLTARDAPFRLAIANNGANLDFEWNSLSGMQYDLVTSTDLTTPVTSWPVYDDGVNPVYENIPATGTATMLTGVVKVGTKRFFALIEEEIPPLFSEGFDAAAGGVFNENGQPPRPRLDVPSRQLANCN